MSDDPLAPLKTDPKLGFFPWWPEDGDHWVHPEDAPTARSMIPSQRVWRRDGRTSGGYVVIHYGDTRLRVRQPLWREAPDEGFAIGDLVEVLPRGMTNDPRTGVIRDITWNDAIPCVEYCLRLMDDTPWPQRYRAHDLKHVERPTGANVVQYQPVDHDDDDQLELAED